MTGWPHDRCYFALMPHGHFSVKSRHWQLAPPSPRRTALHALQVGAFETSRALLVYHWLSQPYFSSLYVLYVLSLLSYICPIFGWDIPNVLSLLSLYVLSLLSFSLFGISLYAQQMSYHLVWDIPNESQ